jgi:hypothetical protein
MWQYFPSSVMQSNIKAEGVSVRLLNDAEPGSNVPYCRVSPQNAGGSDACEKIRQGLSRHLSKKDVF